MKRLMLVVVVLALAGCSQVAALAPVGGNRVSEVRFATIDVLLDKTVSIGEAPTCVLAGDAVTCTGTTAAGDAITSESSTAADAPLTVSRGGVQIFSGKLFDVLDAAAGQ